MDRMELIYAFGEISDKYILEAEVPQRRKSCKRIVTILAAAAILLIGALGAAAYYYNDRDVLNGMKWRLGASEDTDAGALDSITSHEGRLTQNSFEELEIAFSGAICDNEELYAIFTIAKKDGTPFTQPDGYEWRVGFTDTSYDGSGGAFDSVRNVRSFHMQLGEDGKLSLSVRGTELYDPEQKKYDYRFAFTNLYCVPEHIYYDSTSDELSEIYWLAAEMTDNFESKNKKGYKQAEERYFTAMRDASVQSCEGTAQCVVDPVSLKAEIPSYEFEYRGLPVTMNITPIKIKIYAQGRGWDNDSYYIGQRVEIICKDGTHIELECTERTFGGNYDKSSWELIYPGSKPINASQIDCIIFDGIKIDVNE